MRRRDLSSHSIKVTERERFIGFFGVSPDFLGSSRNLAQIMGFRPEVYPELY
jgi:hypothetical protein